eukprot:403333949
MVGDQDIHLLRDMNEVRQSSQIQTIFGQVFQLKAQTFLDPVEREELEKHSRQEYVDAINELEHTPGITQEDIQDFKQSAIIAKSVEVVKLQAEYQKQIRQKAGNNYRDVKSKVARCIKVRNKVTKKNQRDKNEARFGKSMISPRQDFDDGDRSFQSSNMKTFDNISVNINNTQASPYRQSPRLQQHQDQIEKLNKEIREKQKEYERIQQQLNQQQQDVVELTKSRSPVKKSSQNNISTPLGNLVTAADLNPLVQSQQVQSNSTVMVKKSPRKEAVNGGYGNGQTTAEFQESAPDSFAPQVDSYQVKPKPLGENAGRGGAQTQNHKNNVSSQQIQTGTVEFIERRSDSKGRVDTFQVKAKGNYGQQSGFQRGRAQQLTNSQLPEQLISNPTPQPQKSIPQPTPQAQQIQSPQSEVRIDISGGLSSSVDSKFLNKDLERRTNDIQSEFDNLLQDLMNNRNNRDSDGFYTVMSEFYGKGPNDEKHDSPTKRLIQLKNSTSDHKKVMAGNIQRGEYSLTYCSSPGKSYIIEPHGGELNYKIAEKNPLKFYEQVLNQDITKHKFKQDEQSPKRRPKVEITSKVTKRPHLMIIQKITAKIEEKLKERIGLQYGFNINQALQDKGVERVIKDLMLQEKIQLLNTKNQPVYVSQITQAAKYDEQVDVSQAYYEDEAVSPDTKQTKTKLAMQDRDLEKVETEVRNFIRRNSKLPVNV